MVATRLHLVGGDAPDRAVQIDLVPFRMPDFARPLKRQRREFQRAPYDETALIAVDGAHQGGHVGRPCQRGKMLFLDWRQRAPQLDARVSGSAPRRDSETEYLSANLVNP